MSFAEEWLRTTAVHSPTRHDQITGHVVARAASRYGCTIGGGGAPRTRWGGSREPRTFIALPCDHRPVPERANMNRRRTMAWDYAALAKEASKRGGPLALKCFYTGQGVIIGSVITAATIAGTVAHDKRGKRRAAAAAAAEASAESTPTPGDAPATASS